MADFTFTFTNLLAVSVALWISYIVYGSFSLRTIRISPKVDDVVSFPDVF